MRWQHENIRLRFMESYSKLKAEPNESDVKQSNLAEQLGWVCPKSFSPKICVWNSMKISSVHRWNRPSNWRNRQPFPLAAPFHPQGQALGRGLGRGMSQEVLQREYRNPQQLQKYVSKPPQYQFQYQSHPPSPFILAENRPNRLTSTSANAKSGSAWLLEDMQLCQEDSIRFWSYNSK